MATFPRWEQDRMQALVSFEQQMNVKKHPQTVQRAVQAVRHFFIFNEGCVEVRSGKGAVKTG